MKLASEAPFPYGWPGSICYIAQGANSDPRHIQQVEAGRDSFREAVKRAVSGQTRLFAAWPGQYRTDLFLVDEPRRLAEAIGLDV